MIPMFLLHTTKHTIHRFVSQYTINMCSILRSVRTVNFESCFMDLLLHLYFCFFVFFHFCFCYVFHDTTSTSVQYKSKEELLFPLCIALWDNDFYYIHFLSYCACFIDFSAVTEPDFISDMIAL